MFQIRVTSPTVPANLTSWQLLWDDDGWQSNDDQQQPRAKASHLSAVGFPLFLQLLPSIPAAFVGWIGVKQSRIEDEGDPDQPAVSADILNNPSSPPCCRPPAAAIFKAGSSPSITFLTSPSLLLATADYVFPNPSVAADGHSMLS